MIFTVRPLKVHFAERSVGVTTTIGVPVATSGTVTTGDAPGTASAPPELGLVVTGSLPPLVAVVVEVETAVVVVVDAGTSKSTVADCAENPVPAKFAAMTAHE